jgi:hypothetical protein
LRST